MGVRTKASRSLINIKALYINTCNKIHCLVNIFINLCFFLITGLKRGFELEIIPCLKKKWRLSINVRPTGTVAFWNNIIQGSLDQTNVYGDRLPLVSFHPGSTELHVCSAINGVVSYCFDSGPNNQLTLNTDHTIVVEQNTDVSGKFIFSVKLNGVDMFTPIENKQAQEFKNVKVFTSYPRSQVAKAILNSYSFVNL